jgi:photosystem II stability/assembly factor-like uncharacterized protein
MTFRIGPFALVCALLAANALAPVAAQTVPPSRLAALQWRNIGPFRGGRTVAVTGVPGRPNRFYMAPVDGGVWRTDDAGRTWSPIFDDEPTQSIGAIAVAPSDANTLYVGSGEGLRRPDLSVGDGVYRSTDAGAHWTHLGLRSGKQIGAIAVDPTDPKRLFVAVLGHPYGPNPERGLYRSTDGGEHFTRVLYQNPDVGAIAVVLAPNDPQTVYATLWASRRPPWYAGGGTNAGRLGGGMFKSTDGGTTWSELTAGLPGARDDRGRIGIAIAPSDATRMYALVDATNGGVFRSDDAGASWHRTNHEMRVWGRGDDFAGVTVDPKDRDTVYVANTSTYRSVDGGTTFTAIKGAPGGDDYHTVWIAPDDPNTILLGVDQGATLSVDRGATWSSWYNQPTAQFFHVIADDRWPYRVYGGQQESGSAGVMSRGNDGAITFGDWHSVGVEEYGYAAPDPLHPGIVYGGKGSRYDETTGQVRDVAPIVLRDEEDAATPNAAANYRYDRTAPLIFSYADPHTLYLAANVVFATRDGGRQWRTISPDLTRLHPGVPPSFRAFVRPGGAEHRGVVYALAPSHRTANTLWAGTIDGYVWRTTNATAAAPRWTNVTPPHMTSWTRIAQIDASHFDDATAYVAANRYSLDDERPYVYRTHDGGRHWKLVVAGLATNDPVNAVREDPKRRGLLYAASERGVSVSFDDGEHWQSLRANLPPTSVRDLVVHGDDLVVGTHGRSFWIMDDIAALREMNVHAPPAHAKLYQPQLATRARRDTNPDTPLPPEEPVGANPPDGAILDYELPQTVNHVTIEIAEPSGRVVRRYASDDRAPAIPRGLNVPTYWLASFHAPETTAGVHRFVWDMRETAPEAPRRDVPISAIPHGTPFVPEGPLVAPGTYVVTLVADGTRSTRTVAVREDPRITDVTTADLVAQNRLARRAAAAMDEAAYALGRIEERTGALAATLRSSFADANDDFATILGSVESGDAAPTPAQEAAFTHARTKLDATLATYRRLLARPGA